MAKTNDSKAEANADPRDAAIRELEESNGSLAARVGELEAEAATRAADLARLLAAAEQRDAAAKHVEALSREVDELHRALDRGAHASSPDRDLRRTRRAIETNALLTMHASGKAVGVTHERWLSAAMLLADRTAADVEADLAPTPARND